MTVKLLVKPLVHTISDVYQGSVFRSALCMHPCTWCCIAGVSHFVAYETDELLVDEPGAIAANYRRQRLLLDLLSAIPFDWIAYGTAAALAAAAVGSSANGNGGGAADAAAAAAGAAGVLSHAATAAAGAGSGAVGAITAANSVVPAIACLKGLHLVS
jgi:hypothetical protein